MTLLYADSFDADQSETLFRWRNVVQSFDAGATSWVDGDRGGKALRVGAGNTIWTTPTLTNASNQSKAFGLSLRIRAKRPLPGTPLLRVISPSDKRQFEVRMYPAALTGQPEQGHWKLVVVEGQERMVAETPVQAPDTWVNLTLHAFIRPGAGSLELRIGDVVVFRGSALNLTEARESGWKAIRFAPRGWGNTDHVTIDDLIVMEDEIPGPSAHVEDLHPRIDLKDDPDAQAVPFFPAFPLAQWNSMTPAAAGSHHEQVDDAHDNPGQFNASTFNAAAALLAIEMYRLTHRLRIDHGHVESVVIDVIAKLATAAPAQMLFLFIDEQGRAGPLGLLGDPAVVVTIGSQEWVQYRWVIRQHPTIPNTPFRLQDVERGWFGVASLSTAPWQFGRMTVEVVGCTHKKVEPRALPAVSPDTMRPNWASAPSVTTAYKTSIVSGEETLAEERRQLLTKPVRTVQARYTALDEQMGATLLHDMLRRAKDATAVPLWSDKVRLSANVTTDRFVKCDTRYRRFFRGGRIAVIEDKGKGARATRDLRIEIHRITAIEPDTIWIEDPLAQALSAGDALIVPLIDAEVQLGNAESLITDKIGDAKLVAREVEGASALPPTWCSDTADAFRGVRPTYSFSWPLSQESWLPVFDFPRGWKSRIQVEVKREGTVSAVGKGDHVTPKGKRARLRFRVAVRFKSRQEWWDFMNHFDWCAGRARMFWFINPQTSWRVIQSGGLSFDIERDMPLEDLNEFFDVAGFQFRNGNQTLHSIDTIADLGDRYRFTLFSDNQVPLPPASALNHVASAHRARFAGDSVTEEWHTDESCTVRFELVELVDLSATIVLTNFAVPAEAHGDPSDVDDLLFWFDSQRNIYDLNTGVGIYERSQPYPARSHRADRIFDARETLDRAIPENSTPPLHLDGRLGANDDPWLARVGGREYLTNGSPLLVGGTYRYSPYLSAHEPLAPLHTKQLWDNELGFTLIMAWVDGDFVYPSPVPLLEVKEQGTGRHLFKWEPVGHPGNQGRIQFYQTPGTALAQHRIDHTRLDANLGKYIAVVRWQPNNKATTWLRLSKPAETWLIPTPLPFLATPSGGRYAQVDWFKYFDIGATPNLYTPSDQWGAKGFASAAPFLQSILCYRRAITNNEMHNVALYLQRVYGSLWTIA